MPPAIRTEHNWSCGRMCLLHRPKQVPLRSVAGCRPGSICSPRPPSKVSRRALAPRAGPVHRTVAGRTPRSIHEAPIGGAFRNHHSPSLCRTSLGVLRPRGDGECPGLGVTCSVQIRRMAHRRAPISVAANYRGIGVGNRHSCQVGDGDNRALINQSRNE